VLRVANGKWDAHLKDFLAARAIVERPARNPHAKMPLVWTWTRCRASSRRCGPRTPRARAVEIDPVDESTVREQHGRMLQVAVAAAAFLAAGPLVAQMLPQGPPAQRLVLRGFTAARYNAQGLTAEGKLDFRLRLFRSEHLALRENYAALGVVAGLSPAFARGGLFVEVQPLSVLQLGAQLEAVRWFGTFDLVQSFSSARAAHWEADLQRLGDLPAGDPARNYGASGTNLTLWGRLQVRFGPLAVRDTLSLFRPDLGLRAGDPVYYDGTHDFLLPNRGWLMTNDADVLWLRAGGVAGLVLGLRHTLVSAAYRSADFAAGESPVDINGPMHRLGPLAAYTLHERGGGWFNAPTIAVLTQWYLKHRYRAGQERSAIIPSVALAFGFFGDLLPVTDPP